MNTTHEPRAEFVQQLEERVGAEARRRHTSRPAAPRWMPRSPLMAACAVVALVMVSMTLGGAAVAARYEAQDNRERDERISLIQRQVDVVKAKLVAAQSLLKLAQQRAAQGIESEDAVGEAGLAVVEAEMQVELAHSQLAEVSATGREPRDQISSPVVNGQDFVLMRLELQTNLPRASFELERKRLQRVQQRFAIGAATSLDVATSRNHIIELEMAIQALRQKMNVRQQFVARQLDEPMAELRVLEIEAEQRRGVIMPRLDLARQVYKDLQARVNVGTAASIELKQAELRLYELEVELKKAELDLSVVRRQIDQRRGK